MPAMRFPEEKYMISRNEVNQHVSIAALQMASAKLPDFEQLGRASLRKRPTSIYDINGKLLFLDYPLMIGDELVGKVRGAASKVLGAPVISIITEYGAWDFNQAVAKLQPVLKREFRGWTFEEPKLVCYSYPKLGVMFSGKDPQGKADRLIFDVASLGRIPLMTAETRGKEGAYAWSFYDELPDEKREQTLRHFESVDRARLQASEEALKLMVGLKSLDTIIVQPVVANIITKVQTKELQFCSHYLSTELRSHHCFVLHAQQVNDYCAVATCQMILCYYRYYYTQDQIAPALNYSPGGGCPSDQSAGYHNLSNHHIIATFDNTPTYNEAKAQIDAIHPFKSGIAGHARACAGYSTSSFFNIVISQQLKIYDPWPWNSNLKLGGAVYWEDWNSITHTNYVFTRLDY